MGDFVKGAVPEDWPQELKLHLYLHRKLDRFTADDPIFAQSRMRLDPRFRYARGILVDVFYDHFLARNWSRYSDQPLEFFSRDVYRGLLQCFELLPAALQQQLPRMIEYDWLTSYQYPDVVLRVLQRLQQRLKNRFPLTDAFSDLERWGDDLEADFFRFMPVAANEMNKWREQAAVD
ncbi:Acyl carrier protein phosphodiesterase [Malonomonas rubra DSM 5091]|uniref:Acyl carrier protein phosphodiesterase n=2 Tax=Malonomonas rubra TaxID=57040 RepID=A0A1M6BGR2_MALRU|nr:Acyl carrier protein phosphodiesterase [Malonomonas rubra DSM 5091]